MKEKKLFRTHFIANNTNLNQSSLRKWIFIEEILEKLTVQDMPNSQVSGRQESEKLYF